MNEQIRNMDNKIIAYNLQVWRISERERNREKQPSKGLELRIFQN